MLVLTIKPNENIFIKVPMPDKTFREIKVKLIDLNGKKAKTGFQADKDIEILREKLVNKAA